MLFPRLLPLLAAASLLAGCHSARVSYSFRPAPRAVALGQPAATAAPAARQAAPAAAALAMKPVASQCILPPLPARFQHPKPRPARVLASGVTSARTRPQTAARRPQAKPQAPAEVGLGTTVLGVLGLITLPIALLGLLLSGGGLVWGIVAGLAAVAVLVAKLDPFG